MEEKIFATNTTNEVFRPGDIRTPTNPYEKEGNTVEKLARDLKGHVTKEDDQ